MRAAIVAAPVESSDMGERTVKPVDDHQTGMGCQRPIKVNSVPDYVADDQDILVLFALMGQDYLFDHPWGKDYLFDHLWLLLLSWLSPGSTPWPIVLATCIIHPFICLGPRVGYAAYW
jgi:hypothetical protein